MYLAHQPPRQHPLFNRQEYQFQGGKCSDGHGIDGGPRQGVRIDVLISSREVRIRVLEPQGDIYIYIYARDIREPFLLFLRACLAKVTIVSILYLEEVNFGTLTACESHSG